MPVQALGHCWPMRSKNVGSCCLGARALRGQSLQDGIPLVIVTRGCFGREMDIGSSPQQFQQALVGIRFILEDGTVMLRPGRPSLTTCKCKT